MSEKFDWKTTRNTSRSQLIQGLRTKKIHCLAVELSERISCHLLNHQWVILANRFVLMKQNRNFNDEYDDKQFKYKVC